MRPGFEGGQNPLVKALPRMRGFTNIFRKEYSVVNVARLDALPSDSTVTPGMMVEAGFIKNLKKPIKVLGRGDLGTPLAVEANKFSASARRKISAAGGTIKEIK